jgi:hypothetical protein
MVGLGPGVRLGGALEALLHHRQLTSAVGQQLRAQRRVRLAVVQILRDNLLNQGLGLVQDQRLALRL